MRTNLMLIVCAFFVLLGGLVHASNEPGPNVSIISAPEVKDLIDKKAAVVINVLSKIEFDMQHIEGSVSVPIAKIKSGQGLPEDKQLPVIFYCMGER